jgi:hypothetical protein
MVRTCPTPGRAGSKNQRPGACRQCLARQICATARAQTCRGGVARRRCACRCWSCGRTSTRAELRPDESTTQLRRTTSGRCTQSRLPHASRCRSAGSGPCGTRCVGGSAPCECALTSRSALGVAACAPLGVRGYLGHRRQRQQRRLWGWPLCQPHGRCFRRLHVAWSRPRNAQAPRGAALRRRCAERGARAGVARVVPVVSMLSQFRLNSFASPPRAGGGRARASRARLAPP